MKLIIEAEELPKGVLVLGAQGTGKSTLGYRLQEWHLQRGIPFLVIEREKKDYRHWLRIDRRIDVVQHKSFWESISRPPCPEIEDLEWLNALADMMAENFGLMFASRGYIYNSMKEIYMQNIDTEKRYFTPFELENFLRLKIKSKSYFGKERDYLTVCFSRIRDINNSAGHIFNSVRKGFFEELLKRFCVLELNGLGVDATDFLIDWLLTWISKYRAAKKQDGHVDA